MLVVVHQHHAVNLGSDRGVVVFLVARLHADVQLHSPGMQIIGEFLEQGQIAWLCVPGQSLEVDHQAAIPVGGQERLPPAGENSRGHRDCSERR